MTSIIYLNAKTSKLPPGKVPCTLRKFWDMLDTHDWHYEMSDDFGVWQRGNAAHAELRSMAALSPQHKKLFTQFEKFRNDWDRKVKKPARP